jgi:hypothetical protein
MLVGLVTNNGPPSATLIQRRAIVMAAYRACLVLVM